MMQALLIWVAAKAAYIIGFLLISLVFLGELLLKRQAKANHLALLRNKELRP
jgi:hypothetical protein